MIGLVHVYTGNGKGKTTSALGLVLRALGWGKKVCFIQFVKGYKEIGEMKFAENCENLNFIQPCNTNKLDINDDDVMSRKKYAEKTFQIAQNEAFSDKYDLLVLDEINCAVDYDLISLESLVEFIKKKPKKLELVLTGRNAKKEICELADYVTEMGYIKHPINENMGPRKGIEF